MPAQHSAAQQSAAQHSAAALHLPKHALEGPIKQGWLLGESVGQPFRNQTSSLKHARNAGQRMRRHGARAGGQAEQVARQQLLTDQLPVSLNRTASLPSCLRLLLR